MAKYRVRLFGSLPCSAKMIVKADSPKEAEDWAIENSDKFPWDGSDYSRPDGSQIEGAEIVEEIEEPKDAQPE